eukprot:TRINITY_DN3773_c0_g1_i1.p2 TRINITY_DN3773_c0_g1~~TRINITY_DN3773_c0_g1_i1.p2  ORF type:complete len:245 (-),score=27.27 TRINITY_DN3773_c0_g1_i1:225-959(-)
MFSQVFSGCTTVYQVLFSTSLGKCKVMFGIAAALYLIIILSILSSVKSQLKIFEHMIATRFLVLCLMVFNVHASYEACLMAAEMQMGYDSDRAISTCDLSEMVLATLEMESVSIADIYELFEDFLMENEDSYGYAYAASPEAAMMYFDAPIASPYCFRKDFANITCIDIAVDSYNYTDASLGGLTEWYTGPTMQVKEDPDFGGYWTEEFFDEDAGGIYLVVYSVPIMKDDMYLGVVSGDFPTRD